MRRTRARSVAVAAAPLLAASGLGALLGGPDAVAYGALAASPDNGAVSTEVNFTTSDPCPAGTMSAVFSVTGAGFARVAALPLPRPLASAARVEVPLGMSWEELARVSGVGIPLAGTATLTLACLGADSAGTGLFTSVVTFTVPQDSLTPAPTRKPEAATPEAGMSDTAMPAFAEASGPSVPASPEPTPVAPEGVGRSAPASGNEEAEVEIVRLPSPFGAPEPQAAPDPTVPPGPAAPAATAAPSPGAPAATATPAPTSGAFAVTPVPSPSGTADPRAAADPQSLLRAADAPPDTFSWTIPAGAQEIVLDTQLVGGFLVSRAQIAPIEVRDTRPDGPAFAIAGQISDFTPALPGRYIGWRPHVLVPGAGVVAGTVVTPGGWNGGHGLKVPAVLGAAESGHPPGVASLGAELHVQLPRQTPAGTYTTTLTITALS